MLQLIISQVEAFFLTDDIRYIFETLGPYVGAAFIVFLVCAWLTVQIWSSVSGERRKKLEFEDGREKARAELEKMKLEIEAARQRSDAEESGTTLKIVERLVSIQEENSKQRGELYEVLKRLQDKTETYSDWVKTTSESTEIYQAFTRDVFKKMQDGDHKTFQIIETLPAKLDGGFERVLERLAAIGKAADDQHSAIKADIAQVVMEIAKVAQSKPEPGTVSDAGESKESTPAQDSEVAK